MAHALIAAAPQHIVLRGSSPSPTLTKTSIAKRTWHAFKAMNRGTRITSILGSTSRRSAKHSTGHSIYMSATAAETTPSILLTPSPTSATVSTPLTPLSDLASIGHDTEPIMSGRPTSSGLLQRGHRTTSSQGTGSSTLSSTSGPWSTHALPNGGRTRTNSGLTMAALGKSKVSFDNTLSCDPATVHLSTLDLVPAQRALRPAPRRSRSRQALSVNHASSSISCVESGSSATCSTVQARRGDVRDPFSLRGPRPSLSERRGGSEYKHGRHGQPEALFIQPHASRSEECLNSPRMTARFSHRRPATSAMAHRLPAPTFPRRTTSLEREQDQASGTDSRPLSVCSSDTFGRAGAVPKLIGAAPAASPAAEPCPSSAIGVAMTCDNGIDTAPESPATAEAHQHSNQCPASFEFLAEAAPMKSTDDSSLRHQVLQRPTCGSRQLIESIASPTLPSFAEAARLANDDPQSAVVRQASRSFLSMSSTSTLSQEQLGQWTRVVPNLALSVPPATSLVNGRPPAPDSVPHTAITMSDVRQGLGLSISPLLMPLCISMGLSTASMELPSPEACPSSLRPSVSSSQFGVLDIHSSMRAPQLDLSQARPLPSSSSLALPRLRGSLISDVQPSGGAATTSSSPGASTSPSAFTGSSSDKLSADSVNDFHSLPPSSNTSALPTPDSRRTTAGGRGLGAGASPFGDEEDPLEAILAAHEYAHSHPIRVVPPPPGRGTSFEIMALTAGWSGPTPLGGGGGAAAIDASRTRSRGLTAGAASGPAVLAFALQSPPRGRPRRGTSTSV